MWIALGGEVVVDYDLRFKGRYGADVWVTSYANDVMAYIPSVRVLHEGGYEGNTSHDCLRHAGRTLERIDRGDHFGGG